MIVFWLAGYAPFAQARRPLLAAGVLTSFLILPLGIRFGQLTQQARLESRLRTALLNRTITFQQLELTNLQTQWRTTPPHGASASECQTSGHPPPSGTPGGLFGQRNGAIL